MDTQHEQTARILIIDDEESLRLTFEMLLKRAGYESVTGVSSFDQAIAAVGREEFDLIISDIVLQGASGIDLLRQIKEMGTLGSGNHYLEVQEVTEIFDQDAAAAAKREKPL